MRLREALKNDGAALGLAEATLTRLGLTDEAAVAMTDESHVLTGAVAACDKGLVVFTLFWGADAGHRRARMARRLTAGTDGHHRGETRGHAAQGRRAHCTPPNRDRHGPLRPRRG